MICGACQIVTINGILCHEIGCPDAWQTETRECEECGAEFTPESKWDKTCSHACEIDYSGADCFCGEDGHDIYNEIDEDY